MPYFQISILLHDGKKIQGIKEHQNRNIDIVFRVFQSEAEKHFRASQIRSFECFMISRQSKIFKEWIKKKQFEKGMLDDQPAIFLDYNNNESNKYKPNINKRKEGSGGSKINWGENAMMNAENKNPPNQSL